MSGFVAISEEEKWDLKTWAGLTSFNGNNIWTDGENIYYSYNVDQYILDKATSTWSIKTWNGLTNLYRSNVWTDGIDIYYSSKYNHYVLDKATSTWNTKMWNGLMDFYGQYIWTDGDNIYYSRSAEQYVLDKATSTWSTKTWNGLFGSFYSSSIWTDGDNIYCSGYNIYSSGFYHYVLDKATSTWNAKTWNGFTSFSGGDIWTDGDNTYFSGGSSDQYVLDKATSTWNTKTWNGFTDFSGGFIWSDGENIYYSGDTDQYVLKGNGSCCKKMKKGWIEAVDGSKIYKITEKTAVQAPFNMIEAVKIVKFDEKYHAFLLNMSYIPRHYSYDGTQWVEESTIPYQNADQPSIVVYQNKIHFLNYTYHYSWNGTSWSQESNIPFNVTEAFNATVVYNNKIHIVSGNYLYSWDGTSWTQESTLPHSVSYASAVVYQDKIHIMGDYNDPDAHYAWNGTSWDTYPNMPFNNYGGPSCVTGKNVEVIDVFYMNKHYEWYGGGWWIDDGDPVSTLPYACRYPGIYVEDDERTVHLIGGATTYDESHTDNHYMFNRIDYTWGTEIELKELVKLSEVSIYDDVRFGSIKKRIRKAWVGELNREPKLVLKNIPIITDFESLGNNLPFNMTPSDNYMYRLAAVSYNDRIHVLGGEGNVHYSFSISYNSDGDPVFVNCRKETAIPYDFKSDNVVVLGDSIHLFGSAASSDYMNWHYRYRNGVWTKLNNLSGGTQITGRAISVAIEDQNVVFIFQGNNIWKYDNSNDTLYGATFSSLPFYIDNISCFGEQSATYDKDNNRIIIVDFANATCKFYSLSLSYDIYEIGNYATLLKTVTNTEFSHPLYLDETVVPNGNKNTLFLLGGSETDNFENVYTICGSKSSDSWSSDITLPYGFHAGNAVFYNGKIHILGTNEHAISTSDYNYAHYSYDGFSWVSESTLPYEFGYGGEAVVYNNRIYIMGGHNNKRGFYYWNGSSWYSAGSLPYDFERGSSVVYNNKIHLLGGIDSGSNDDYWSTKTWNGLASFNGNQIWTDGTDYYYSSSSTQYVLNKSTSTWNAKTWSGLTSFNGQYIWTDGTNYYYSAGSKHYILDKSTSTWSAKTWNGLTSFYGDQIWTDGTDIYYSNASTQYVLDKSTSKWWNAKTWSGLTSFNGRYIWTDGTNIYYSAASTQYVLDKATSTWSTKTWSGLTSFDGRYIWTDGTDIYYSYDSDQYVLDKSTSTWSTKTWSGITGFGIDGMCIWTDGTDVYYSYYVSGTTKQYVLNKPIPNSLKHYYYNGSSWTKTSTDLPYSFNDGQAIVAAGGINILGGNGKPRGHYSWNGSSWSYQTQLPYDFIGGSAILFDNNVHIMGGYSSAPVSTSLNYHYVWGQAIPLWNSRENLPTNVSYACAVSMITPVNRFIAGWTSHNVNLASTGFGAFSTITDPSLRNCISWTGNSRYPLSDGDEYNKPAATVAHNGRIYMIDVSGSPNLGPVLNELRLSRYYDSTSLAIFTTRDDDLLGSFNINRFVYDKHNMFSFGGSCGIIVRNGNISYNSLYIKYYDKILNKWKDKTISSVTYKIVSGSNVTMTFDLDSSPVIPVIYDSNLIIFTNATEYYNNNTVIGEFPIKITYNTSTGAITIDDSIYTTLSDGSGIIKFTSINRGAFLYNNCIYFLGGVQGSTTRTDCLVKWDISANKWSTCGYKWEWSDNHYVKVHSYVYIPICDKFGYAVMNDHLHMIYTYNGVAYHKSFNLITEIRDDMGEHPLMEPLMNLTPPSSSFDNICFTSDYFMFVVVDTTTYIDDSNTGETFKVEELEYYDEEEDEWKSLHSLIYPYTSQACKIRYMDMYESSAAVQYIEMITSDDNLLAQYEATLDEYFN